MTQSKHLKDPLGLSVLSVLSVRPYVKHPSTRIRNCSSAASFLYEGAFWVRYKISGPGADSSHMIKTLVGLVFVICSNRPEYKQCMARRRRRGPLSISRADGNEICYACLLPPSLLYCPSLPLYVYTCIYSSCWGRSRRFASCCAQYISL